LSPKKLSTRSADLAWARGRRRVAEKYYEVADLIAEEDGASINVCVGLCVLAGIAAGDAICAAATGERYSGRDHAGAAGLLSRIDTSAGKHLRDLVALKPPSHYGENLLRSQERDAALRAAAALISQALKRTSTGR
jgi:hypothetical protein